MRKAFVAVATLCLFSTSAMADTWCSGRVLEVALNPMDAGTLYANVDGVGMRAYCNIATTRSQSYGTGLGTAVVSTLGCGALYSMFLTAKATGKTVSLYFAGTITCGSNGTTNDWFTVSPQWVRMND